MKNIVKEFIKVHGLTLAMLLGAVVSISVAGFTGFAKECERLPSEVLRLHILAQSDSEHDQHFKLQLRDYILEAFSPRLSQADTLEAAHQTALTLLPEIEAEANRFAELNAYDYSISAEITQMYFTTRVYDNVTLPAGNYTALRIVIGDGAGENWWCVMFPMLCVPAVTEASESEFEEEEVNELEANQELLAVNLPEAKTESPKVKFAIFEFFAGLFR